MKFSISFTKAALKSLKSIDKSEAKRIMTKIELLSDNPYP